jgi:hypothetical protein
MRTPRIAALSAAASLLVTLVTLVAPAHAKATPWNGCPTRQSTIYGDPNAVVSPSAGGIIADADLTPAEVAVRQSLQQETKYLLNESGDTWVQDVGSTNDELAIRVPAMTAFAVAVALRTNGYAPSVTGVPNADARDYIHRIVTRIACQHEAVALDTGWGRGWQTAHWAFLTGMAAWLTWGDYTDNQRQNIVAMVKIEADRLVGIPAPFWSTPSGSETYPGDSKAEEDAWNAELLMFADEMMPSADTSNLWRRQAVQYAAAAFSVRADTTSGEVVNGVPMRQRAKGFNALDFGAVINHHIVHPDYANAIQWLWQGADVAALGDGYVPEAMFHNAGLVYSGLSTYDYTPGGPSPAGGTYNAPGGPVYQPDGDLYYPQGDDWGTARRALWLSLDAHADVYRQWVHPTGQDPADALAAHEAGQQALWSSSGATDGRTYSIDPDVAATEDTYPGREEYAANNLATAWLAIYVAQTGKTPAMGYASSALPPSKARRR